MNLSGKIIDGEISGATVFLDLNRDGVLDTDEPTAKSDGNGTFILTLTAEQKNHKNYLNKKAPIVIYGGVDIRTGKVFEDYLTAIREDSNFTNVTPLSTLIAETLGEELDNDVNNRLNNIDDKMNEIKENLAELLDIKKELLTKDPIELAKEGDVSLLDVSLQMHKIAKKMKKAMKSELKDLRRSILKSYRAMAKSLKKLKKTAIKSGDTALLTILDDVFDDNAIFDNEFKESVKEETKDLSKDIRGFWRRNRVALSDDDVTNALNGVEIIIVDADSSIVNDTKAPVIIRLGRKDIRVVEGDTYEDRGAIARDNKDGNVTGSIVVNNPVDVNTVGTYTITYDVSDAAGNKAIQVTRTVKVTAKSISGTADTTKPTITIIGLSTVSLIQGTAYIDAGATASDNEDGNISSAIVVNNSVNINAVGIYSVTYDVSDAAGNKAIQVTRIVKVTAKGISVKTSPIGTLVWPLCGQINKNQPEGWTLGDNCPSNRFGVAEFSDFPISSSFGPRQLVSENNRYDFHRGLDIPTPTGTPVFAIADGKVYKAGKAVSGYDDPMVMVRHFRDGYIGDKCTESGGCLHSVYLHLSSVVAQVGIDVSQGDLIGYTGASDSGFEHLHFEIREAGVSDAYSTWQRDTINPLKYLNYETQDENNISVEINSVSVVNSKLKVITTIKVPIDELDLTRVEVEVYKKESNGTLTLKEQSSNTPNSKGYYVNPPWFDMEIWNHQYTHKDSSNFSWESFGTGGENECAYASEHPTSYTAHNHLDQRVEGSPKVGSFNGVLIAQEHYNASSSESEAQYTFNSIDGVSEISESCIYIKAIDVQGNETVKTYNCTTTDSIPVTFTTTSTLVTTTSDSVSIVLKGAVGRRVFVNGIEVGIISSDGTLAIDLNTSGINGIKTFTITLVDELNKESLPLVIEIERIETPRTAKENFNFLNLATFGATKESEEELKSKGVEAWIDEQFSLPYVPNMHLTKTINMGKQADPTRYVASLEEYLLDNDTVFNMSHGSFELRRFQMSAWFDTALLEPDQLRHRVAYALSQIIVASTSEPFFIRRAEGLATYLDILTKNAFGNYRDLLLEITHSPTMALYLTYNGSKKEQISGTTTIYPDENYARELMQLFTIGLSELNIDGTVKVDEKGNGIPTYTQTDVNELAKIFTGWDLKRSRKFGHVDFKSGDLTHPLKFTAEHHEMSGKTVLGTSIQAGNDGSADIVAAIDILMAHPNIAPFVSKQLILRLVKSNPSPAYVARVATVFNDNGKGVKGDLKAVTRAIFLDTELREEGNKKFKEPLLAYTQFLRAFKVHNFPKWRLTEESSDDVINTIYIENPTRFLGQGPARALNVFNFYDNTYVPSDAIFKAQAWVAPELQIQTDSLLIAFNNNLHHDILSYERDYILSKYGTLDDIDSLITQRFNVVYYRGRNKFLLDCSTEYTVMERELESNVDGVLESFNGVSRDKDETKDGAGVTDRDRALLALIEHLAVKLTGGSLLKEQKDALFNAYKEVFYYGPIKNSDNPQQSIHKLIMAEIIPAIVTSETYMVQ